ncbi:hypothetical protein H0H81_008960 [Sphagnurus paluster]|uniref:Uncharacterized protein n=1 Tax=Sphagnurus paluster TaxID=117069 RepID=A0A9P7FX83_9AGAR|nr:hypothetical protein H0H81_008960 [Sphagnurus paluster]
MTVTEADVLQPLTNGYTASTPASDGAFDASKPNTETSNLDGTLKEVLASELVSTAETAVENLHPAPEKSDVDDGVPSSSETSLSAADVVLPKGNGLDVHPITASTALFEVDTDTASELPVSISAVKAPSAEEFVGHPGPKEDLSVLLPAPSPEVAPATEGSVETINSDHGATADTSAEDIKVNGPPSLPISDDSSVAADTTESATTVEDVATEPLPIVGKDLVAELSMPGTLDEAPIPAPVEATPVDEGSPTVETTEDVVPADVETPSTEVEVTLETSAEVEDLIVAEPVVTEATSRPALVGPDVVPSPHVELQTELAESPLTEPSAPSASDGNAVPAEVTSNQDAIAQDSPAPIAEVDTTQSETIAPVPETTVAILEAPLVTETIKPVEDLEPAVEESSTVHETPILSTRVTPEKPVFTEGLVHDTSAEAEPASTEANLASLAVSNELTTIAEPHVATPEATSEPATTQSAVTDAAPETSPTALSSDPVPPAEHTTPAPVEVEAPAVESSITEEISATSPESAPGVDVTDSLDHQSSNVVETPKEPLVEQGTLDVAEENVETQVSTTETSDGVVVDEDSIAAVKVFDQAAVPEVPLAEDVSNATTIPLVDEAALTIDATDETIADSPVVDSTSVSVAEPTLPVASDVVSEIAPAVDAGTPPAIDDAPTIAIVEEISKDRFEATQDLVLPTEVSEAHEISSEPAPEPAVKDSTVTDDQVVAADDAPVVEYIVPLTDESAPLAIVPAEDGESTSAEKEAIPATSESFVANEPVLPSEEEVPAAHAPSATVLESPSESPITFPSDAPGVITTSLVSEPSSAPIEQDNATPVIEEAITALVPDTEEPSISSAQEKTPVEGDATADESALLEEAVAISVAESAQPIVLGETSPADEVVAPEPVQQQQIQAAIVEEHLPTVIVAEEPSQPQEQAAVTFEDSPSINEDISTLQPQLQVVDAQENRSPVPQVEDATAVKDEEEHAEVVVDEEAQERAEDTAPPDATQVLPEVTVTTIEAAARVEADESVEEMSDPTISVSEDEDTVEADSGTTIDPTSISFAVTHSGSAAAQDRSDQIDETQTDSLVENENVVTESSALVAGEDAEQPKSSWMPSFQVTTVGRGVSSEEAEPQATEIAALGVTAEVTEDVQSTNDIQPTPVLAEAPALVETDDVQVDLESGVEPPIVPVIIGVDEKGAEVEVGGQPGILTPELVLDTSSLDGTPEPASTWTPSYSVHSQGSPRPENVELPELDSQEQPARPWTPSYSVHSQGSPLPVQASLPDEQPSVVEQDAFLEEHEVAELEEMEFAINEDVPATIPAQEEPVPADEPSVDIAPEHEDLSNTLDIALDNSSKQEGATLPVVPSPTLDLQKQSVTRNVVVEDTSEETLAEVVEEEHAAPTIVTEVPILVVDTSAVAEPTDIRSSEHPDAHAELERPPSPANWVPSYSVSVQGSPSQERLNPLEEVLSEIKEPPVTVNVDPVPEVVVQDTSVTIPQVTLTETLAEEDVELVASNVAPVAADVVDDEADVDEAPATANGPVVVVDANQDVEDVVGTHALAADAGEQDRPKSPWTPSYSVTTQGSTIVTEQAELDQFEPLPQRLLATKALQDTTVDVPRENTPSVPVDGVDEVATSNKVFPSLGEPDRPTPISVRLVPLDEDAVTDVLASPAATSPSTTRSRLESTTSSRFFPGSWFSPTYKVAGEGRASLEFAQGEFVAKKSPPSIDDTPDSPAVAEGHSTGESEDDDDEMPESATSDQKRKWCVIM